MSNKAYYFCKNFNFAEIMNLMRYGNKHPETLTNIQKTTRLYRSTLRRCYSLQLESTRTDFGQFNETVTKVRSDFQSILNLPENDLLKQKIIKKYEDWQEEYFDPNIVIDESRPYAPASSRYFIWSNEHLQRDPFGYYKPRLVSDRHPSENVPFFEDYPSNDSQWNIMESFPADFDDTNNEKNE